MLSTGLLPVYVSQKMLGQTGDFIMFVFTLVCVVTTAAAQVLAVSSIIIYDIYQVCSVSVTPARYAQCLSHLPGMLSVCHTCQVCSVSVTPARYAQCLSHLPGMLSVCHTCQVYLVSVTPARYAQCLSHLPGMLSVCHTCQVCSVCVTSTRYIQCLSHLPYQ